MKWYTGIIAFEDSPDGYHRTPEVIHVQASSPSEARHKVEQEHIRQVLASLNGETYIDPESGEEYEYEVFVPEGVTDARSIRDYAINLHHLFEGKLEDVRYK